MRVILFTGKGGVGKTTTAAATAVRAARGGVKTLVMSTDPAHSLGEALGVELRERPDAPTEVEPGLFALARDGERAARQSWRGVQDYLVQVLDGLGLDPVVADEVASLPGAEEVVALLELREQVASGPYDLVVVDCAPTAETLRLLALPEALAWHLERLAPASRGFWRALRPAAAAAAGVPLPDRDVVARLGDWQRRLCEVHDLLTAPTTSVRLVLTPEKVVIAEARRMLTSLRLHGLAVDQVVVNRLFPGTERGQDAEAGHTTETGDAWRRGWHEAQREGLALVHESFDPVPVVTSTYLDAEPIGPDRLETLVAGHGPVADLLEAPDVEGMTVRPTRGGFTLSLPLPLVSAGQVDLQRRQGDLLIEVDGHRRVLALPSALQRCTATGGSVRDGRLRVRFVPDEEVWPRGS